MLIDTHCHLNDAAYHGDAAGLVQRANEAGVDTLVTIGTDVEGSRQAVSLARQFAGVYAVAGIHPQEAHRVEESWWKALEEMAQDPKVKAIGETGLDYYRDYGPRAAQAPVFHRLIQLAKRYSKPLVIHTREASADTVKVLWEENAREIGGVFHCFTGDPLILEEGRKLGFYFGIGGVATYPSAKGLREMMKEIPRDRLLLETDAPYLPPQSRRGQRNESSYLVETAAKMAEILGLSPKEVEELTGHNARQLFRV